MNHPDWKTLADLTTASFAPPKSEPVKPSAPARHGCAPLGQGASFSTTRKQYQPALQNQNIAQALAQLQQMRKNNRPNPSPRVVTSQFRPATADFIRVDMHTPARVHRPKK